ncbi:hypothetical protein EMCRGX_G019459 [Ephydatia muelleri]
MDSATTEATAFAKAQWSALCKKVGVANITTCKWWEVIQDHYAEPWRNPKEVAMAVYFHDIIYEPKLRDNEERSADLFMGFAAEALTERMEVVPDNVVQLILETKLHHTEAHEGAEFGTQDVHYLLDFDMSILGQIQNAYKQYAANIRKEYIHVPLSDYCHRRAQVLTTFLESTKIFCTDEFYKKYEHLARINVQQEIYLLSQNTIPSLEPAFCPV